jgi:hypothetical protein
MDCEKKPLCKPYSDKQYTTYDNLEGMPLAMAYVPWQQWQHVSDAQIGFKFGTIFEELVLPFYGVRAACVSRPYPKTMYEKGCDR